MLPAEDQLVDTVLYGLYARRGADVFVVVIGAMDGETYDPTRGYVNGFGWRGLFVEPVPELYDRLVRSFPGRQDVLFEQAAISDRNGELEMAGIPSSAVHAHGLNECFEGMASLLPVRNGFSTPDDAKWLEQIGERIRVPALTLPALLAKHDVERIDILQIDVEGYDWMVLRQLDLARYRPSLIRFERSSLPEDERAAAVAHLEAHGYHVVGQYEDYVAIAREALAFDTTIVTAVYELHADTAVGGRSYSAARYLRSLVSLSALGASFVVYTQHRLVERLEAFFREQGVVAKVIAFGLDQVPRFWDIQGLRIQQRVHLEASRDRCHALCHGKLPWLAATVRENPFKSSRFYWIDAGLAHEGLFPARHLPRERDSRCGLFTPQLIAGLRDAPQFVFLGMDPMQGNMRNHIPFDTLETLPGVRIEDVRTHVVGGMFGGTRDAVLALARDYDAVLAELLAKGVFGTEEPVLSLLYHSDPARFSLYPFTTWYHEDTDFTQPGPDEVPFYRAIEQLAGVSAEVPFAATAAQQ